MDFIFFSNFQSLYFKGDLCSKAKMNSRLEKAFKLMEGTIIVPDGQTIVDVMKDAYNCEQNEVKKMEIITKLTASVRPDPNQPRKTFDKESLKGLAQTYTNQGIIEPIEVDGTGMIITGERRWRATKIAGIKKIPCKVTRGLTPQKRLERQLIEDVQKEEIPIPERDKAWYKLWVSMGKPKLFNKLSQEDVPDTAAVSNLLGVSRSSVSAAFDRIGFFSQIEPKLTKEIKKLHPTTVSATKSLPMVKRKQILKQVIQQTKKNQQTKKKDVSELQVVRQLVQDERRKEQLKQPQAIPIERFKNMLTVEIGHVIERLNRFNEVVQLMAEKGILSQLKCECGLKTVYKQLHDTQEVLDTFMG